MRYLDIIIFVLCLNVGLFMMNEVNLFGAFGDASRPNYEKAWIESYNETMQEEGRGVAGPKGLPESGDYLALMGALIGTGIDMLFRFFFQVVLFFPTLLALKIPIEIALPLSYPIWAIYAWGIFQVVTGRSGKQME